MSKARDDLRCQLREAFRKIKEIEPSEDEREVSRALCDFRDVLIGYVGVPSARVRRTSEDSWFITARVGRHEATLLYVTLPGGKFPAWVTFEDAAEDIRCGTMAAVRKALLRAAKNPSVRKAVLYARAAAEVESGRE